MSTSRSVEWNTSPRCTKPCTEWKISLTTPRRTSWRRSAPTSSAGEKQRQEVFWKPPHQFIYVTAGRKMPFFSLLFPEFLCSRCFTGRMTSLFRWNPARRSPSSSPRCLWRCRSTCFLESATPRSSLTSCCQTGASTPPSSAASNRSSGNFGAPAERSTSTESASAIFDDFIVFIECEQNDVLYLK